MESRHGLILRTPSVAEWLPIINFACKATTPLSVARFEPGGVTRTPFVCLRAPMVFRASVRLLYPNTAHLTRSRRNAISKAHPSAPRRTSEPENLRIKDSLQDTYADDPSLITQVSHHSSSSFHWRVVPETLNPRVREKPAALVSAPFAWTCGKQKCQTR